MVYCENQKQQWDVPEASLEVFKVDFGSWEQGVVYTFKTTSCSEAMKKAHQEGLRDDRVSDLKDPYVVQVHDSKGNIHFDYWNGGYPNKKLCLYLNTNLCNRTKNVLQN